MVVLVLGETDDGGVVLDCATPVLFRHDRPSGLVRDALRLRDELLGDHRLGRLEVLSENGCRVEAVDKADAGRVGE